MRRSLLLVAALLISTATSAWAQGGGGGGSGGSSGGSGGAGAGSGGGATGGATSGGAPALGGTSTPGTSFNAGSPAAGAAQPSSPTSVPGSGALPTQNLPGTGLAPNAGSNAAPGGAPAGVTNNSTPANMVPDVTTPGTPPGASAGAAANQDLPRALSGSRTDAKSNYRGVPSGNALPADPDMPQSEPSDLTDEANDGSNPAGIRYWQDPNIRWRYVWFKGQWWYWMPDKTWRIWNGADWMSEAEFDEAVRNFATDRANRINAETRVYRR